MAEAAQVAGLGQDGQGVDRADAGDAAQQLVVGALRQEGVGCGLDRVALPYEATHLADDEPEHAHRRSVRRHRQADRAAGCLVDVAEQLRLGDLAPDDIPGGAMKASLLSAVMLAGVGKRSRKAKNQSERLLWRKRSISGKYSAGSGLGSDAAPRSWPARRRRASWTAPARR